MTRLIAVAPIVLIATLYLSLVLADRVKEHALQDRLSFGDSSPRSELPVTVPVNRPDLASTSDLSLSKTLSDP
jgi:hypothetical protein